MCTYYLETIELHMFCTLSFFWVIRTLFIRGDMAHFALPTTWLHGPVGFHRRSFKDEACPGDTLEFEPCSNNLSLSWDATTNVYRSNSWAEKSTLHHLVRIRCICVHAVTGAGDEIWQFDFELQIVVAPDAPKRVQYCRKCTATAV
jgi:hypothetical protein